MDLGIDVEVASSSKDTKVSGHNLVRDMDAGDESHEQCHEEEVADDCHANGYFLAA